MSGEQIDRVKYHPTQTNLGELKFTQSPSGHVHSPWFTYDYDSDLRDGKIVYGLGYGMYARVAAAAKSAFAAVLDISEERVYVTEKKDLGTHEILWRLSTLEPCRLPSPPTIMAKPKAIDDCDVIDVVATEDVRRLE